MNIEQKVKALEERIDALESKPAPQTDNAGLFAFVRPNMYAPQHGLGSRMDAPDVLEAVKRACSSVNYQGDQVLAGGPLDEVWNEIEGLKVGVPELREKYAALDPAFAGFALLTGLLAVSRYDSFAGQMKRDALAGQTIFKFLSDQLKVAGTPGIAVQ